jgi:hypothetical protein
LLAGGSAMVFRGYGNGTDPATYFLIKQQPGNFTNATLKGKYTVVMYGYDETVPQAAMPTPGLTLPPPNGFIGDLGIINFNGGGQFTITGADGSENKDGSVVSGTDEVGTYSVSGDGTFSFTTGGGPLTGRVLADGSTFIMSPTTPSQMSQIVVGLIR